MHCPFCRHPDSRVVDSRETDEGQAIRRRRSCPECGKRFTTWKPRCWLLSSAVGSPSRSAARRSSVVYAGPVRADRSTTTP